MLCWRYCNQKLQQEQPSSRFENNIRSHAGSPTKDEPNKVFLGSFKWQVHGIHCHIQRVSSWSGQDQSHSRMQPPKNLKELWGLQGRLAYIRRFIVNLSGQCQPFTRLIKKGVSFVWDDACQKTFEDIKAYLTKPPVLTSPVAGKPFLLYERAMDHSLGALLAQKNDESAEQAIYYLSRTLIGTESRNNPIEKECLALSSPYRRCGITWSGRLFMSSQESTPFGFGWQSRVLWTLGWLIRPYCCPNMIWLSYPRRLSRLKPS